MAKKRVVDSEELPSNSISNRVAPMRPESIIMEEGANIPEKKARIVRPENRRAMVKKRTFTQSIAKSFLSDETRNVGSYIINDVLVPAAKNLIQEMITSGIEMVLFGETSGRSRSRGKDRDKSVVSYSNFYKDRDERERRPARSRRDRFDLNDIYFRYGDEADEVLGEMCDRLEEYEEVTVADYFELAGIDGATHVHHKWGWKNLSKAYCTHTREGYTIVLPDPIDLD